MAKRRILVSWVGHNDLLAMAADLPATKQKKVLESIRRSLPPKKQSGPIRTVVESTDFAEIHLLSNNLASWVNQAFVKWLPGSPRIHDVVIANPTDYPSIFAAADGVLSELVGATKADQARTVHPFEPRYAGDGRNLGPSWQKSISGNVLPVL